MTRRHDRQRERGRRRNRLGSLRETHDAANTSWRDNPYTQRTIAQGWDEHVATVLDPAGADEIERTESRRAFYAGAHHLLVLMLAVPDVERDHPASAGPLIEARRIELEAFARRGLVVVARVRELGEHQPPSIVAGWLSFERAILDPIRAGHEQRLGCRRAFFAGAHQMFRCYADTGGVGVTEDEGEAYLEERRNEIVRLYRDMQEGRA
jgi:hypothetical protein